MTAQVVEPAAWAGASDANRPQDQQGTSSIAAIRGLEIKRPYGQGLNARCAALAEDQAIGMDPTANPCENPISTA